MRSIFVHFQYCTGGKGPDEERLMVKWRLLRRKALHHAFALFLLMFL